MWACLLPWVPQRSVRSRLTAAQTTGTYQEAQVRGRRGGGRRALRRRRGVVRAGVGWIGGSFMSGEALWAVIGVFAILFGVTLLLRAAAEVPQPAKRAEISRSVRSQSAIVSRRISRDRQHLVDAARDLAAERERRFHVAAEVEVVHRLQASG